MRSLGLLVLGLAVLPGSASAGKAAHPAVEIVSDPSPVTAVIGGPDDTAPALDASSDTTWIADWSFEPGGFCTSAGWIHYDNRILNDGSNYWRIESATCPGIGSAATLVDRNPCRSSPAADGPWDYSVRVQYRGVTSLEFDFSLPGAMGLALLTVEADSACASNNLVNYSVDPSDHPSKHRVELAALDGGCPSSHFITALPTFGNPSLTHCVYLRFTQERACGDGECLSEVVGTVDNLSVSGGFTYTENFEDPILDPHVELVNSAPSTPFGEWGRLYAHLSDNDKCTENRGCAWAWADPTLPPNSPCDVCPPGIGAVRNWLDNIIVSPWVALPSTGQRTVLSFRRFGGSPFQNTKIVQGWRVRTRARQANLDTPAPGDSIDCTSPWKHADSYSFLNNSTWSTASADMTEFVEPNATEIQVSFRTTDWQLVAGEPPPATLLRRPGPFLDRIRIGRRVLTGPTIEVGIDTRNQAQDCFPTVQNAIVPGQHFSPAASDIFGTCAFSEGTELGLNSPGNSNLITGDSIWVENITDARFVGGITAVRWYGAITAGPHVGKGPAPYVAGGNGFFEVTPDSARNATGVVVAGRWFVDLDDSYFRGGDQLKYFWTALDAAGGRSSAPAGITQANFPPVSVGAAEAATGGLYEFNALPGINWDPTYLAAIAADPHGDLDPTPGQLANSTQRSCILYYQHVTSNRRSGIANRTSFMYTLDRLGYMGRYDVYDVQGYGNTNNQLGGRANVAQCSGYRLIIEDDGRSALTPNIPDGSSNGAKIDQAQWYRDYLAQGQSGLSGIATLWILGENTAFEGASNPLFTSNLGLGSIVNDQGLNVNPNVNGQTSFTFTNNNVAAFAGDMLALNGGCPAPRAYDAASNIGAAVMTHRYATGQVTGPGAVIMNKSAATSSNTIWMGFGWDDIREAAGANPGGERPELKLARKILTAALCCVCFPGETTPTPPPAAPLKTELHQNVPNPFNPATTISFDLAASGRVRLEIFDVAGRSIRTLLDEEQPAGWRRTITWNGQDDSGRRVASGVYLYRLTTADFVSTRRLVVMK